MAIGIVGDAGVRCKKDAEGVHLHAPKQASLQHTHTHTHARAFDACSPNSNLSGWIREGYWVCITLREARNLGVFDANAQSSDT